MVKHSVFDFLYQDAKRISSLLAQFDPNGVLQSLTKTDSFDETTASRTKMEGSLNAVAAKGTYSQDEKVAETMSGAASRGYDVAWSKPLALLDYLQQHNFVSRSLGSAHLGQIVLIRGSLGVFDVPMLRSLFSDMGLVKRALEKAGEKKTPKEWEETKSVFKFFTTLPLSTQALLATEEGEVWMVIEAENLQTAATNLFLKYGVSVPGEWMILGILDALPSNELESSGDSKVEFETAMDIIRGLVSLSDKMGRPKTSFGITPLLVFREVESCPPRTDP